MAIGRYTCKGAAFWRVDVWVREGGQLKRKRIKRISTKEKAKALEAKWKAETFEGRWFDRARESRLTVGEAWKNYAAAGKRNDSWSSDKSRAAHLLRHLGNREAGTLGQADVDAYRTLRGSEKTKRGGAPSAATLDREVELLKRFVAYAKRCGKLSKNPLEGIKLLREPNVRKVVLDEQAFLEGLARVEERSAWMKPILLTAYDTGMRIGEVLHLRRDQVDWKTGRVELRAAETKTEEARVVYLSARAMPLPRFSKHLSRRSWPHG